MELPTPIFLSLWYVPSFRFTIIRIFPVDSDLCVFPTASRIIIRCLYNNVPNHLFERTKWVEAPESMTNSCFLPCVFFDMRSIDLRNFFPKFPPVTKVGLGDLLFDDFDFIRFFLDGFEGRFSLKRTFLGMFVSVPTTLLTFSFHYTV